jgi:hypothetical protein
MVSFVSRNLTVKVILLILLATSVPAIVIGYVAFRGASGSLRMTELVKLENARDSARKSLVNYLTNAVLDLRLLASTWSVRKGCAVLSFYGTRQGASEKESTPLDPSQFKEMTFGIEDLFKDWLDLYGPDRAYHDLLVVVGEDPGVVAYSHRRGKDLGAILRKGGASVGRPVGKGRGDS